MSKPKQRQPLVSIGAHNLWKLACAASDNVEYGDEKDPYVIEIRKLVGKATHIAKKAMDRKDYKL